MCCVCVCARACFVRVLCVCVCVVCGVCVCESFLDTNPAIEAIEDVAGSQFTCFTGTKVQILTYCCSQRRLRDVAEHHAGGWRAQERGNYSRRASQHLYFCTSKASTLRRLARARAR
jgi:hypothetical protein